MSAILPFATEQRRGDAIDRLLGMVELLGADYVEGVLRDMEAFGMDQEWRWFRSIVDLRASVLRKAEEQR